MNEKLVQLHNLLCQIETKGTGTITMAACIKLLRQIISEEEKENNRISEQAKVIKELRKKVETLEIESKSMENDGK